MQKETPKVANNGKLKAKETIKIPTIIQSMAIKKSNKRGREAKHFQKIEAKYGLLVSCESRWFYQSNSQ